MIVGASAGGSAAAILPYECAPGFGTACGPLLGAALGDISWRHPFFGTATPPAIGFLCITAFLKEQPKPARTFCAGVCCRRRVHGREQHRLHRAGPRRVRRPRPVASAGCNFARWFAAAAAHGVTGFANWPNPALCW